MSCIKPSTGYYAGVSTCSSGASVILPTPGKSILFSPETPQGEIFSPSFTVVPGSSVLIDAYNMPTNAPIYVNRVLKSNYGPRTGDNCDPCAIGNVYNTPGIVTFRERMTLGTSADCWQLIKYSGSDEPQSKLQMLILVPGIYQLELSETEMLGDMQVEYMQWDNGLTPGLPAVYHAGVCTVVKEAG